MGFKTSSRSAPAFRTVNFGADGRNVFVDALANAADGSQPIVPFSSQSSEAKKLSGLPAGRELIERAKQHYKILSVFGELCVASERRLQDVLLHSGPSNAEMHHKEPEAVQNTF